MKKFSAILLIIATLSALLVGTVCSASDFGAGISCIANEVKIIKSGLLGRKITFSDADFKQGLSINDFFKITITKLPPAQDGTLMIAGRRVSEGVSIKRKNLPTLVFIPSSKEVTETSFGFKIDGYASGEELSFVLKFTDKVNYEPEITKEESGALTVSTQREICLHGKLSATDKEGDKLEYIIVSYPNNGTLTSFDKESGEYVYSPLPSYTGEDSFIYVVRDEWGNFSKTATVNISVIKRMSEVKYVDMQNRSEYNAAVAMTAMGVMGGKIIGDGTYFMPDETVTKAEFVAMAMKSLGIRADSTVTESYFDDNDKIPTPLLGYVATAQRLGLINGVFKNGELLFNPNDTITKYEAAVIMANLVSKSFDGDLSVFSEAKDIPCWARAGVYAMCAAGVFELGVENLDTAKAVTRADAARYLYKITEIK